jgi:NAD(P)-dependent dehydrogenase (short-subunit alcohol dehydrogenase family)
MTKICLTDFRGKTAVVTGGASGMGKGIAQCLIDEGMRVFIADVEEGALERTADEIGAIGITTDVSDLESVQALAARVRAQGGTIHLLCNNAGVGPLGRIADLSIDDWRWVLNVNLWGVIHGVQTFLPILRANADGGYILNTASIGGLVTMPGLGPYAVSKYGVVALSETLAQELAEEKAPVGVTVLCPGPTRTNIKSSTRNRPRSSGAAGGLVDIDLENTEFGVSQRWIEPRDVGRIAIDAMRRGQLYAYTHPEQLSAVETRFAAIMADGRPR